MITKREDKNHLVEIEEKIFAKGFDGICHLAGVITNLYYLLSMKDILTKE